jgi:transcriptional regulator with XRE-family HTH domain
MLTHKQLRAKALAREDVATEYERLGAEFDLLDEFLRARAESGLTQAEVAERIGTTQSAVARMESGKGKHSPSIATLTRYAEALGHRLEIRLIRTTSYRNARTARVATATKFGGARQLPNRSAQIA